MTEQVLELKQRLVVGYKRDGRCSYDPQAKRELIEASLQPGVSVAKLALMHGINANLLRKWIGKYRGQSLAGVSLRPSSTAPAAFIPVVWGLSGATDEFTLAALVQNLRRMTKLLWSSQQQLHGIGAPTNLKMA